jgi:hypothetical protein
MSQASAMLSPMTCVACLRSVPCWRVLRISARDDEFPDGAVAEGGLDDEVDGHVPLCGQCLLVCPTCERPVVPGATARVIADVVTGAGASVLERTTVVLRWFVEPCTDSTHMRPAVPGSPPAPSESTADGPRRHRNIPGECWVADEWRGLRVGDEIEVPGLERRGVVFEIWSHRLGGGVACTIVFPDGTWLMRRAADIVRAQQRASAQPSRDDAE